MSATIMIGSNTIARIDNGEWASADPHLTNILTTLSTSRTRLAVYDPNPDYTEAAYVADVLDGKVIAYDHNAELPEGAVW